MTSIWNPGSDVTLTAGGLKARSWETTATAAQTLFVLPFSYVPGNNLIAVYANGVRLSNYEETSETSITLGTPRDAGDVLLFIAGIVTEDNVKGVELYPLVTDVPSLLGEVTITLPDSTHLQLSAKGSDGVVRSVTLNLS
jgi:hypothetical protein